MGESDLVRARSYDLLHQAIDRTCGWMDQGELRASLRSHDGYDLSRGQGGRGDSAEGGLEEGRLLAELVGVRRQSEKRRLGAREGGGMEYVNQNYLGSDIGSEPEWEEIEGRVDEMNSQEGYPYLNDALLFVDENDMPLSDETVKDIVQNARTLPPDDLSAAANKALYLSTQRGGGGSSLMQQVNNNNDGGISGVSDNITFCGSNDDPRWARKIAKHMRVRLVLVMLLVRVFTSTRCHAVLVRTY